MIVGIPSLQTSSTRKPRSVSGGVTDVLMRVALDATASILRGIVLCHADHAPLCGVQSDMRYINVRSATLIRAPTRSGGTVQNARSDVHAYENW
jgi:hypothetical protein